MACCRKKSAVTRREVASSLTCLAPFSQYSFMCRWPEPGSGHAQPGQSKPLVWFTLSNVNPVRRTVVWPREYSMAWVTAGTPVAHVLGGVTKRRSSLGSSMVLIGWAVPFCCSANAYEFTAGGNARTHRPTLTVTLRCGSGWATGHCDRCRVTVTGASMLYDPSDTAAC